MWPVLLGKKEKVKQSKAKEIWFIINWQSIISQSNWFFVCPNLIFKTSWVQIFYRLMFLTNFIIHCGVPNYKLNLNTNSLR